MRVRLISDLISNTLLLSPFPFELLTFEMRICCIFLFSFGNEELNVVFVQIDGRARGCGVC